jgi:hypothetical protein
MLDDTDRAHVAIAAILAIQPLRESDILSLTNVLRIKAASVHGASPSVQHSSNSHGRQSTRSGTCQFLLPDEIVGAQYLAAW